MSELQQLQQEGEMPIDDLLASLPPEMLEGGGPVTPESEAEEEDEKGQDREEEEDEKLRKKKEAEEVQLKVRTLRKRTQQQRQKEDIALSQSGSEYSGQQSSRKWLVESGVKSFSWDCSHDF